MSDIENYLQTRKNPDKKIEIYITGGLEWVFKNQDVLEDQGINPILIASVLDADENSISDLSLLILQKIADRERLQNKKIHMS